MNCIIVIEQGVLQTPILIKDNTTADATYEKIVRDILDNDFIKEDFDNVVGKFVDDSTYDKVNEYLKSFGIEIHYFTDLKTL